jgi:hypothetical protein
LADHDEMTAAELTAIALQLGANPDWSAAQMADWLFRMVGVSKITVQSWLSPSTSAMRRKISPAIAQLLRDAAEVAEDLQMADQAEGVTLSQRMATVIKARRRR